MAAKDPESKTWLLNDSPRSRRHNSGEACCGEKADGAGFHVCRIGGHAGGVVYHIKGIDCNSCAGQLEEELTKLKGVVGAHVNLLAQRARLLIDPALVDEAELRHQVHTLGIELGKRDHAESEVDEQRLTIPSLTADNEKTLCDAVRGLREGRAVTEVTANLKKKRIDVEFKPEVIGPRDLLEGIVALGYKATIADDSDKPDKGAKKRKALIIKFVISLCLTIPIVFIEYGADHIDALRKVFSETYLDANGNKALSVGLFCTFLLCTPVQLWIGLKFYHAAWKALSHLRFNVSVLVSTSTSLAYFYSVISCIVAMARPEFTASNLFEESAVLITIILLGNLLETVSKGMAAAAIRKLPALQAKTALLVQMTAGGNWGSEREIPGQLVQRGDVLKVLPGTKVPCDGKVVQGTSEVDESMVTGESVPVHKGPNDRVVGATINLNGLLYIRADKVGKDAMLSQIVSMIERAQTSKAPIERFADQISQFFVPTIFGIALLTFVTWFVLLSTGFGTDFHYPEDMNSPGVFSLLNAITVMIIACPCAMGLATPTAVMVGASVGLKNGVLIKTGGALERAYHITTIVFDKTGTLTTGNLVTTDVAVLNGSDEQQVLRILGSVESGSEHPIARAILRHAYNGVTNTKDHDIDSSVFPASSDLRAIPGEGVGCMTEGQRVLVGNRKLMSSNSITIEPNVEEKIQKLENEGKTTVLLALNDAVAAIVAVADTVKPEAAETVQRLSSLGIKQWIVSGDHERVVQAVARQLNITNFKGSVLPSEKSAEVQKLQAQGEVVAMVGDGVNDSVALAQADVGIAIGGGADIAAESAGLVLVKSDLRDVFTAIHLSRVVFRRIRLNFVWALGYNVVAVPLATGFLYPITGFLMPAAAAAGLEASSTLLVVFSSLLLNCYTKPNSSVN